MPALFAHDGNVKIAEIVDEYRLRHRLNAEAFHAGILVCPGIARMLDPVAPVRIGHCFESAFKGIEGLLDGGVADGMNSKLVALGMIIMHEVVHLVDRAAA